MGNSESSPAHPSFPSPVNFTQPTALNDSVLSLGTVVDVASFLLKTATLEGVRRLSKSHCPWAWRGLQTAQIFCYPPFRCLDKWLPGLMKNMQAASTPLLLLTVTSSLLDWHPHRPKTQQERNDRNGEENIQTFFYSSVQPYSAIQKTSQWRRTFNFLPLQELEMWSAIVFWHGEDKRRRPALFVRLGLVCSITPPRDKSQLTEVIVSQIEHGINRSETHEVIVVIDCEGYADFSFTLETVLSCAFILHDHYPCPLAALLVTRLPLTGRIVGQTLLQWQFPDLRIGGDNYQQDQLRIGGGNYKIDLTELFETLPWFLEAGCLCPRCDNNIEPAAAGPVIIPVSVLSRALYALTGHHDEIAQILVLIAALMTFFLGFLMSHF